MLSQSTLHTKPISIRGQANVACHAKNRREYGSGRSRLGLDNASSSIDAPQNGGAGDGSSGPALREYLEFGRLMGDRVEDVQRQLEINGAAVEVDDASRQYLEDWQAEQIAAYEMFEQMMDAGRQSLGNANNGSGNSTLMRNKNRQSPVIQRGLQKFVDREYRLNASRPLTAAERKLSRNKQRAGTEAQIAPTTSGTETSSAFELLVSSSTSDTAAASPTLADRPVWSANEASEGGDHYTDEDDYWIDVDDKDINSGRQDNAISNAKPSLASARPPPPPPTPPTYSDFDAALKADNGLPGNTKKLKPSITLKLGQMPQKPKAPKPAAIALQNKPPRASPGDNEQAQAPLSPTKPTLTAPRTLPSAAPEQEEASPLVSAASEAFAAPPPTPIVRSKALEQPVPALTRPSSKPPKVATATPGVPKSRVAVASENVKQEDGTKKAKAQGKANASIPIESNTKQETIKSLDVNDASDRTDVYVSPPQPQSSSQPSPTASLSKPERVQSPSDILRRSGPSSVPDPRKARSMQAAVKAMDVGEAVEVTVWTSNAAGVLVESKGTGIIGFVPFSELSGAAVAKVLAAEQALVSAQRVEAGRAARQAALATLVGRTFAACVVQVDEALSRVILSEKTALRTLSKRPEEPLSSQVLVAAAAAVGRTVDARVRSIRPFGAFLEFELPVGNDTKPCHGLCHVSELSWDAEVDPGTLLHPGQHVQTQILFVNEEKGRVFLSIRRTQPNPLLETLDSLLARSGPAGAGGSDAWATSATPVGGRQTIDAATDLRPFLGDLGIAGTFADALSKVDGIDAAVLGCRLQSRASSQELEVYMARAQDDGRGVGNDAGSGEPTARKFRLVLRSGQDVQELEVTARMTREALRDLAGAIVRELAG